MPKIIQALAQQREYNPHAILGFHEGVIRLWRPDATQIYLEVFGQMVEATPIEASGLFEYKPIRNVTPTDYRVYHTGGLLAADPYSFLPQLGDLDTYLFNAGRHYELATVFGANFRTVQGISGVLFTVWAPNATAVSLVGDFNHWDGRVNPMRTLGVSGIWELFIPGLQEGTRYKYEVRSQEGKLLLKSDPFARFAEVRPYNASIVYNVDRYQWQDAQWMQQRKNLSLNRPINIYEVHLGSWKQGVSNYRQMAAELARYCLEMGFTHIELMPLMEHPLDESWGYQVTGFYAVTSRYGTPEDFQFLVDYFHQQGLGVIIDWVPAHFPIDDFSLALFDGTALYEHADPRKGFHPHWQTAIFNYGRKEISNFLLGSALYWIEKMHIDGLRVDAVASMLYLDYGREAGQWIPNPDGSNFNLDAIEFLKHLNSIVHQRFPGVTMIAEESSAFAGVTKPEGLGFDLKWNMGWMNDTLEYFAIDPLYRKYQQNKLTFSLFYSFSEQFLLPLSHDEVVHGKKSLLAKIPGSDWQKFASIRLMFSYMMGHPGKKLIFMGAELGQWDEWKCKGSLSWDLLQYPLHSGLSACFRDLNHFYLNNDALWQHDFSWEGYQWIDFSDADQSVISYLRKGSEKKFAIIHNFTPEYHEKYFIPLPNVKQVKEVFNTDQACYGGSGQCNHLISLEKTGFAIDLAPLATLIFEVQFE